MERHCTYNRDGAGTAGIDVIEAMGWNIIDHFDSLRDHDWALIPRLANALSIMEKHIVKGRQLMVPYLNLVNKVLEFGDLKQNRTGVDTLSLFGEQTRDDLRQGFPLVTTKKIYFKSVVAELLWFLRGATNIHDGLAEHTSIWDPWADEDGELGPIYGYQWRKWRQHGRYKDSGDPYVYHIDQIYQAISTIKSNPDSRRIIVSAWNVAEISDMALPPCHLLFQF